MRTDSKRPIWILGALFFVFGFITWLGSVLIPYLRIACQLSNLAAYLVAFSFYISYTVMALPAAAILRRTGYRRGMALGLLVMACGSVLFLPAAAAKSYPLFLTGLFVQGTGLALLQTASNPYITIIGPLETAARRIGIMGICNGIAGVVGPLILGAVILKDADGIRAQVAQANPVAKAAILHQLAQRVILPYAIIVVALLIMAALIYRSGLPEPSAEDLEGGDAAGDSAIGGSATTHGGAATRGGAAPAAGARTSILQFPYLLLGVFTLFLYVGVEVIAGDTIINYGSSQGIPLSTARFFSSCTLSLMLVGYVLGIILIPKWLSQVKVLQLSGLMGLGFATLALLTHGYVSVAFIALLGLANAMVWPSIWPLAIGGLGRFTKLGASLLIVAVGGGALLPLAYGWLAGSITPHFAYLLVLPCYGCIWYYATAGHKIGLTSTATT